MADGTRVKFWHDLWCGDSPLKEAFLEFFRINLDKDSSIVDLMQFCNSFLHWDVHFSTSSKLGVGAFVCCYGINLFYFYVWKRGRQTLLEARGVSWI